MTDFLRRVSAHTADVKTAYERGFKDAMTAAQLKHPDELMAQCYEKWVRA